MPRSTLLYSIILPQVVMVGVSHTIFTSSMFWITLYAVSKLRQILANRQMGACLMMR